ncbi:hypothetical protein IMZ48_14035 [Candidatus Bathyarchaeota archaeon]|nr:hypothetical protein [Candidatus Bathyarchaeota archaeon]
MYDCTFIGCPEPTTGSCTFEMTDGTYTESGSYTIPAENLVFNALTLATPLPEPLKDECDSGAGGGKGGDDEDAGSGDEDSEDDKNGAAGSVTMAWLGLVPGLVLGLAI